MVTFETKGQVGIFMVGFISNERQTSKRLGEPIPAIPPYMPGFGYLIRGHFQNHETN